MGEPDFIILAATDGTRRSRAVLARAALLARGLGANLALVHVRQPGAGRFRLNPTRMTITALQDQFRAVAGSARDLHILDGAVDTQIPELANQLGAGLVVMGLHRERRVLDALRLTTLERVTLAVACPVLIAQTVPVLPYTRVLAALCFDAAGATGLNMAARLALTAEFNGIHALHHPLTQARSERATQLAAAQAQRSAFMSALHLPVDLPMPEIVRGGVHEVLRYRMAECDPDLLVIGSQSGRDPAHLGNYARDLMRAPPTDVLVTKPSPESAPSPKTDPRPAPKPTDDS